MKKDDWTSPEVVVATLTAIVAMVGVAISIQAMWQSRVSEQLARDANLTALRAVELSFTPYLVRKNDVVDMSFGIENIGNGPARIYAMKLTIGETIHSLEERNLTAGTSRQSVAFEELIAISNAQNVERLRGLDALTVSLQIDNIAAGETSYFLQGNRDRISRSFADQDTPESFEDAVTRDLLEMIDRLEYVICYTNLSGTMRQILATSAKAADAIGGRCPPVPEDMKIDIRMIPTNDRSH